MPWNETLVILNQLINNALILLGLSILFTATNFDTNYPSTGKKIVAGLAIGGAGVFILANPWVLGTGLIFDTRSVLYSISGLFFGWLPTIIGAAFGIAYRISIGGAGVYAGVLTIINTSLIGLFWSRIRRWIQPRNMYIDQFLLGFIAHVVTMLGFFAVPNSLVVMQNTWFPYLVIFPLVNMVMGVVLINQHDRLLLTDAIKKERRLLQAAMDSTHSMEMYALDRQFQYLTFNAFHFKSMQLYYQIDVKVGMNFLSLITNSDMHDRYLNQLNRVFLGEHVQEIVEVENAPGKYLDISYTPIYDDTRHIIGVTVFSHDITERRKSEQSILHLSYHDALTGLGNRRLYDEKIKEINLTNIVPVSVVLCDVNGLKMMNDAFGHDAGDDMLMRVADVLKQHFSEVGSVYRIGGDEFVAILPNTLLKDAIARIEIVKAQLASETLHGMNVSLSYGAGVKIEAGPLEEIIRQAEETMYRHKLFEVSSHRSESIKTILNTLHEKNPREHKHSERVSRICHSIGMKLGMTNDDLRLLTAISNLHDIGKIAIDERILNKPGKLTDKEWEVIKTHPEIGYRIISTAPEYAEIADDILSHHERFDGTGYPRGLKGHQIPLRVRIISLADAFDAMVSDRPYRLALSVEQALAEIKRSSGSQFDPMLVDLFLAMMESNPTLV